MKKKTLKTGSVVHSSGGNYFDILWYNIEILKQKVNLLKLHILSEKVFTACIRLRSV